MVKIPFLGREPKPDPAKAGADSGKAKGQAVSRSGNKPASPPVPAGVARTPSGAPVAGKDPFRPAAAGTGTRQPFPLKRREESGSAEAPGLAPTTASRQPPAPAAVATPGPGVEKAVAGVAVADDGPGKPPVQEMTQSVAPAEEALAPAPAVEMPEDRPPEAAVAWDTVEEAAVAEVVPPAPADALVLLRAVPDLLFRIGPDGVQPATGQAAPGGDGGPEPGGKDVMEELARRHGEHTQKALETRQLQSFEFQVRRDAESCHLEARLVPLNQAEVLALVRDVTGQARRYQALVESRNELENHLSERKAELIRINNMLKGEVGLRNEQEEVLKKNFRRLERLLEDTIGAITLIVEERDPHVADHQRRVSQLACAIGQDMNLRNDQMRAVRMAAQLHDLGKIFIPAEILRKPGQLTPAEMSVVKTHPDTDYRVLKRIDFPISIADVVRQHHERMDGSGYPRGLKGDAILPEARILAVADVIVGMVFERPYRVAPGLEAALKEIADNKATLYDTAVVEACLRLFAEGRFKFETAPGANAAPGTGPEGGQDL